MANAWEARARVTIHGSRIPAPQPISRHPSQPIYQLQFPPILRQHKCQLRHLPITQQTPVLCVTIERLHGRFGKALIAPLIQCGLIKCVTRTTNGLPKNSAASAVTRQAMDTQGTYAVMATPAPQPVGPRLSQPISQLPPPPILRQLKCQLRHPPIPKRTHWSLHLLPVLCVTTERMHGRLKKALIAPLIQCGLITSVTRTTNGSRRNGAATAVTKLEMGIPETSVAMTVSSIGRTCAHVRLISTCCG